MRINPYILLIATSGLMFATVAFAQSAPAVPARSTGPGDHRSLELASGPPGVLKGPAAGPRR